MRSVLLGALILLSVIFLFLGAIFLIGWWLNNREKSKDRPPDTAGKAGLPSWATKMASLDTYKSGRYWFGALIAFMAVFFFGKMFFTHNWTAFFEGHYKAIVGLFLICFILALMASAKRVAGLLGVILLVVLVTGTVYELNDRRMPSLTKVETRMIAVPVATPLPTREREKITQVQAMVYPEEVTLVRVKCFQKSGRVDVIPANRKVRIKFPDGAIRYAGQGHEKDVWPKIESTDPDFQTWEVTTEEVEPVTIVVSTKE